jgi:pimeloyl-ACP methyl ester carboxylesterase
MSGEARRSAPGEPSAGTSVRAELVQVTTADGVVLHGLLQESERSRAAVLMMHGNSSSFYQPFFAHFAERMLAMGWTTLRANNRGHDVVSRGDAPGSGPPRYLGAAFERVDECPYDWAAWLDHLERRGHAPLVVWGHSLGAVKTAYYLAREGDRRVAAAVLASPPRLAHAQLLGTAQAEVVRGQLEEARRLVESGHPEALLSITLPIPFLCSAATYLDKYGPGDPYDVVKLLERVEIPVLLLTGEREVAEDLPFIGLPEAIEELRRHRPRLAQVSIPGADHHYTGRQAFVLDRVIEWLSGLGLAP